jgi:hypothetical protein
MLTGVEILLERMKTNPEEFIEGEFSKWSRVINGGWEVFTEEERTAIQSAMNEAKRDHFNGEVMRVLAQGHADQFGKAENYLVKPSKIIAPQNMIAQATQILNNEFDRAYALQNTTSNPYQQRK